MKVSLEIVPRDPASIYASQDACSGYDAITSVNVPDLFRFDIRSWEACALLAERAGPPGSGSPGHPATSDSAKPVMAEPGRSTPETTAPGSATREYIPHLRAIDYELARPFPHADLFRRDGIRTVLVIAGDPPQDMKRPVYPSSSVEFIRKLKAELPWLTVYAAFDPYRTNISHELEYLRAKEAAGADGFMSQPFFDLRLLEIYAEYLEHKTVFWGISPVVSGKSRNYWEARNRAIFPRSFRPTLEWNITFAHRALDFCRSEGFNAYLMPINVDLRAYLSGLFG